MEKKRQTPSQTIGPFFAYGLTPEQYSYEFNSWFDGTLTDIAAEENTITIVGKVFDGEGVPADDAMVEIWQNDQQTQRFGRYGTGTDKENRFLFQTTKPESVDGAAPFLSVVLFMRGLLLHLYTRIYFSDEEALNAKDEVLLTVPQDRRHTLIAQKKGQMYTFNIYVQGENETVFFDI